MAQLDSYLVEKLKEILQRLYMNRSLDNPQHHRHQHSIPYENDVTQQQQQVAYKRSPSPFQFAPSSDLFPDSGNVDGAGNGIKTTVFTSDKSGQRGITSTNYYGIPRFSPEDDYSIDDSNVTATYGTELVSSNCTAETSVNRTLDEIGKVSHEDESTALTRSLHEFIHILKMSLKSAANPFHSNSPGEFYTDEYNHHHGSAETFGVRRDSVNIDPSSPDDRTRANPFSGIEAASTTTMEFNLTLDDITDLNNLLEGDDPSGGLPLKHLLIITIYFLIACVSIIGNLLVIQLVIRSRRFHTLTHALLANLAAADLVLATFNIPFSAARVIMSEWPFGSFLCRAVPFLQVTSVYATSFTMAVIEEMNRNCVPLAMDRYQVIMNPLGKRLKCSQGILLVFAIWAVSAVLSLPYALNHRVVTVLTVRVVKRCQAEFGFPHARQLLTVATFLAQYLLPLLFTSISYMCIMKRLWHRSSDLGSTTPRQVAAQSRAKLKTIKMLVLTVIFFAATWLPIHLYHLFTHFSHVRHNSTSILICHMIAMSSSMYNPFIFCGLNEHFRREAVKWLRCFRTRRTPIVHPGMEVGGLLARADQPPRRNMSTTTSTAVHTTLSSTRRSPQHQQQQQQRSLSPNSSRFVCGQQRRKGILAATSRSSPAAIYVTPRHAANLHNPTQDQDQRNTGSPAGVSARPIRSIDSLSRNGSSTPSGYQPESLFLVKDSTILSAANGSLVEPEGTDSVDEDINVDDFLDSFGDEIGMYEERDSGREAKVRQEYYAPHKNNEDDILSSHADADSCNRIMDIGNERNEEDITEV